MKQPLLVSFNDCLFLILQNSPKITQISIIIYHQFELFQSEFIATEHLPHNFLIKMNLILLE